jgi:hypothetical protein
MTVVATAEFDVACCVVIQPHEHFSSISPITYLFVAVDTAVNKLHHSAFFTTYIIMQPSSLALLPCASLPRRSSLAMP